MGVSFKVSNTGTRFRPKPLPLQSEVSEDGASDNNSKSASRVSSKSELAQSDRVEAGENIAQVPNSSISSGPLSLAESEVSFTLNLFPDGYSIGKPFENETTNHSTYQDFPKLLHPYDKSSESLFLAIESGRLPGDILDDIPSKYVDGALVCEVCDYRRFSSEKGCGVTSTDCSPTVYKVCLKMSLENIVKDIPSITDDSWTYGDLMEVESKILKALQPKLHLDPTPMLDRLCDSPVSTKLNLGLSNLRRKQLRHMPEFAVTSSNRIHGKKVFIDRVPESSSGRLGDSGMIASNATIQQTHENAGMQNLNPSIAMASRPKCFIPDSSVSGFSVMSPQSRYQMAVGTPRSLQEHGSVSAINASGAVLSAQDVMISYADNANSSAPLFAKRENQDGQTSSPLSNLAKRMKPSPAGVDAMQTQQLGSHVDALPGSDMNWQNNTLLKQQAMARGIQKFSQLNQDAGAVQFASGQHGMRIVAKEEQFEMEKLDGAEINRNNSDFLMEMETRSLDSQQSQLQQKLPQHAFMRPNFPQTTWNNLGQHLEREARKEDQLQKRKSVQSPRLSAHSPLSIKSGEFSNCSAGPSFGPVPMTTAPGASQKEKTTMAAGLAVVGTPSLTSSGNDSTQRQQQAQVVVKWGSNSLPKTPAMTGVGSPGSAGTNVGVPLNASSPSIGTSPLVDPSHQTMLERFSKIDMVMRHQLSLKKNKADDFSIRKQNTYSPQLFAAHFANATNNEGLIEETCSLSKSLIGGRMNVCKMRVSNFVLPDRVVQGNNVSFIPRVRTKMMMSEKPSDGTVVMYVGDIEETEFIAAEDHLPTLPNTHFADLLADQFCSQMAREGYVKDEDRIQLKPNKVILPSGSQSNVPPNNSAVEMQQYGEPVPGQTSIEVAKPADGSMVSLHSSQNLLANPRTLPPGNPQVLQMSQGLLSGVSMASRPQQLDSQQAVQQQQQQQLQQNQQNLIQHQNPQFQRSPTMLGSNPLSHLNAVGQNSNMQLGNHMVNKASPLQMQLIQQQLQHQQSQPQMQRKMMGLGTAVGVGNLRNTIVGLGPMGMGAARGIGGTGISAPVTSISGMGNMGQNSMNLGQASNITNAISQQLRSGAITSTQAEFFASKLRMAAQSRGSMLGSPQSSIAAMSGARQMHPGSPGLSMLSQSMNRANMGMLQRAMGPMGPPKLTAGMNLYMNQQQQQQPQQQQQHQQQMQLQQQLQQQQETASQLQGVVSPQQVGSPSTMGVPPLNQQTPQQQPSSQQMSQRTPMSPQQMSSGAIHAMSTGNPEACPASPQLSSQTMGSVSSITNSPMDMQGVNKSNSVSNAQ